MRSFASDNNAGVSPEILEAIRKANSDHVLAYGDDPYTQEAEKKFQEHFGSAAKMFLVFNGTAANVLSLKSFTQSYEAIVCAKTAHIYTDECGAPEKNLGSKLIPVETPDGKLTPDLIAPHLGGRGDQHHVQPRAISVTQSTELGTVYSLAELKALSEFAKDRKLILHMDGARISNAAVSLNCSFKEMTTDVGVDVLSFGGTKNGIVGGEAVVFLNKAPENFKFLRKQMMQLSSKSRFVAAQFTALLSHQIWKRNATWANEKAQKLASAVRDIPQVKIVQPVQANAIFAQIPKDSVAELQRKFFFYVWDEAKSVVRWMTSFDTTDEDISLFVETLKNHFR